jgi:hypothetical protein
MKSHVIAVLAAAGLTFAGSYAIRAQSPSPGATVRIAQADEEVSVKKKMTPYGVKKIVKKRSEDETGMGCKQVSVTKTNEMGDRVKKTSKRCG